MLVVLSALIGALIGWIGSLIMRTATSEGIARDILVGLAGGLAFALLFGSNSMFDAAIASYLGAVVFLLLLYVLRKAGARSKGTVTVPVNSAHDAKDACGKADPAVRKPKQKKLSTRWNVDARKAIGG